MKKLTESISLILPAYNEEKLIESCLARCIETLSLDFEDFEIIVVDDGSTDKTAVIAGEFSRNDNRVKIVYNIVNLNVGISVQRGISSATKDFVIHNAADLALAPEDISTLVPYLKDCDVLVLERKSYAGYTLWRLITSKVNRILLSLLFPFLTRGIRDLNFTQFYRRSILPKIMPLAKSPSFTTPEMIIRARHGHLRVKSILVDYRPRTIGKGAFGKFYDILWSLTDMLRFRIKL
ncbi:MAG: glycosyltransferase family 2 protein [Candidatus Omnitrophota bacterium]